MREYMKTLLNGLKQQIGNIKIPKVLPNPHPLRLTGAVEATYDGSEEVTVEVPDGDTDSVKTVNGLAPDENGNVQIESAVQPDWNQNDSTAKDYVKNRPFYEDVARTTFAEAEVDVATGFTLPSAEYIYGDEYIIEINGERYPMSLSWQLNNNMGSYFVGFNLKPGASVSWSPSPVGGYTFYLYAETYTNEPSNGERLSLSMSVVLTTDVVLPASVKILKEQQEIRTIDPKYLPDEVVNREPLLLNADMAETYLNDSSYGDAALEAIKDGKEILVRVPNADGGNYTAIYSPVLMHQVPNYQNNYLYLFFLRDEKQDLSALLGQPAGTVLMPTYGQLKMLLSQEYNSDPLEA